MKRECDCLICTGSHLDLVQLLFFFMVIVLWPQG